MSIAYLVGETELGGMSLAGVGQFLASHPKKVIGDVSIGDLAGTAEWPNGVYLFYKTAGLADELVYVGKATSRSFIDRIPSHFDPREEAWMNSLPKHAMKSEALASYSDALQLVLGLKVVLVGSRNGGLLESALRSYLAPRYNATRLRFTGTERLADVLGLPAADDRGPQ